MSIEECSNSNNDSHPCAVVDDRSIGVAIEKCKSRYRRRQKRTSLRLLGGLGR